MRLVRRHSRGTPVAVLLDAHAADALLHGVYSHWISCCVLCYRRGHSRGTCLRVLGGKVAVRLMLELTHPFPR